LDNPLRQDSDDCAPAIREITQLLTLLDGVAFLASIGPRDTSDKECADGNKRDGKSSLSMLHIEDRARICGEYVETRFIHGLGVDGIILPRNVNNLANLTVNGRMEAMIVSWGQSEDRQAGPIKRERLLRVCGDIEKTGYVEVFSLYPKFLGQVDGLIDSQSGICCGTKTSRVVGILDWASAIFELSIKELVERLVFANVWLEELIQFEIIVFTKDAIDFADAGESKCFPSLID